MPVTVVVNVIAGVVPPEDVPARPLAEVTETELTPPATADDKFPFNLLIAVKIVSVAVIVPVVELNPVNALPVTVVAAIVSGIDIFELPLNETAVEVASPVAVIVLAVCKVVAVVAFPDNAPENVVVVNVPVLGLYVNPESVLGLLSPVVASENSGYLVAFVVLSSVRDTVFALKSLLPSTLLIACTRFFVGLFKTLSSKFSPLKI
jgi:hypothetical protein